MKVLPLRELPHEFIQVRNIIYQLSLSMILEEDDRDFELCEIVILFLFLIDFSAAALKKMGAPRKWIKQFLGLKKSDKTASSEEENVGEIF